MKKTPLLEDAMQAVRIAAAHHRELVELQVDENFDVTDQILVAGDVLDVAIVLAHLNGARAFDVWKASRLPLRYVTALTEGILD